MTVEAKLFVVATPIGNLGDWTDRAREVISQVRWVAVEDTRVSRKLLEPFGLRPHLISLHEHNERHQVRTLVDRLQSGESGVLMSDAGTPLVSSSAASVDAHGLAAAYGGEAHGGGRGGQRTWQRTRTRSVVRQR